MRILVVLIVASCATSCMRTKHIFKGNEVFFISDNSKVTDDTGISVADSLYGIKLRQSLRAKVDDKSQPLLLSLKKGVEIVGDTILRKPITAEGDNAKLYGEVFFPAPKNFFTGNSLKYFEGKIAVQTLAIAVKVRPEQKSDGLPVQAETGSTIGVAPGWRFNYVVQRLKKNILGQSSDQISLTPGLFIGAGSADIKKGVSSITLDRKEPIMSWGGYVMIGFNSIHFGVVLGQDRSLGSAGAHWLYNKKWWRGFAVGIDLIK